MIRNYQEEQALKTKPSEEMTFAKIAQVYSDGVTLIFPGETAASKKRYKTNTSVLFKAGDKVRVIKKNGTYIVEYAIGNPRTS